MRKLRVCLSEQKRSFIRPPSVIKKLQAHVSDVLILHHPFYFSGALKKAMYLRRVLQGWHA